MSAFRSSRDGRFFDSLEYSSYLYVLDAARLEVLALELPAPARASLFQSIGLNAAGRAGSVTPQFGAYSCLTF